MNPDKTKNIKVTENDSELKRPLFFSVLCLVTLLYNGIIILFLLSTLIFSDFLTSIINQYYPKSQSFITVAIIILSGIIIYSTSFIGVLRMRKLKKNGFYLFLSTNLLIILIKVFLDVFTFYHIIINILLILLFFSLKKKLKY